MAETKLERYSSFGVLPHQKCGHGVYGGRLVRYGIVLRWATTRRLVHGFVDVVPTFAAFVERYNQCWRLEKLAYRTPLEAREQYELRHAA